MSDRSRADLVAGGTLDGIGEQDHSVTAEYRIFGPPGTGKTTNLWRQIRRAVERFGPESVLVTSFSRAAAAELAGRELPLRADRIGTLHSHCYHAIGRPAIAEAQVEEWNRENPHLGITPVNKQTRLEGDDASDEDGQERDGDHLLRQLNRMRGLMLPREVWPANVREFATRWQRYKDAHGLLDFCDLIEICYRDVAVAPSRPSVIFVDEAQDLSPLQMALIRRWGANAQYFVVVGDEDQILYSWCGCVPESLLDPPLPSDRIIILKQSYRVPRTMHAAAGSLIRQVSRRQEKIYLPRPAEGACRFIRGTWRSPEYAILKAAVEHLDRGQTVMFLASCSYMLAPVVQVLRREGIPFHNPYRKANGFWNPLRLGRKGAAANRILALLAAHPALDRERRIWTGADLALWAEWLYAKGIMKPGAKKRLGTLPPERPITIADLDELFEAGALEELLACFEGDWRELLRWWKDHLSSDVQKRAEYPLQIAATGGPQALVETPKVIVGTIHSVKGGEADVVFLFPDLSQAGDAAYQRFGGPRDAVIRTFYVGMTRAREALYVAEKDSAMAVTLPVAAE